MVRGSLQLTLGLSTSALFRSLGRCWLVLTHPRKIPHIALDTWSFPKLTQLILVYLDTLAKDLSL